MAATLLATKLYVPPVRPALVSRPRLFERLNASKSGKLALVSAAAGFGKTTLVAEWLNQADLPHTWLSLDGGDNDPLQFISYLIAALQRLDADLGRAAHSLLSSPQLPPMASLITLLINDIAESREPMILVLDDYEVIHAEVIHQAVEFLIEHQPPQLQLILVTRQDPPLPLPRLRVRGQLTEIHEKDLRFTPAEARQFLKQALAVDLDSQLVAALEGRTEGWIAGLQLAALSMRGRPAAGIVEFVERFSGSHRHVIDYLAEEVLSRQSDGLQDFMCQTSILDRMSAPLCDAVTGRGDGKEILRQLDAANLFLVPLDDQREWYRYHRLFADFLQTELDADLQAALHARASRWLVDHGLLSEAAGHALASGNVQEAVRVVGLAAGQAFRSGALAMLQTWLDALPNGVVWENSELATYQGWLAFFTGQTSQTAAYAEAAEHSLPADAGSSARGRLLSLKAHVALCTDALDDAAELSREALACLEPGEAVFRNLTSNLLGQVLEARGDVLAAASAYREAVRGERGIGNEIGTLVMFTNLVFVLNELGHRREAEAICQQAAAARKTGPGRPLPVSDGINLAWSLLSYEANELEQAREQVEGALALAAQAHIAEGVSWGQFILARIHLAHGDLDAARQLAREGQRHVAAIDAYEGKIRWFSAVEAQANLLQGDVAAAERWAAEAGFSPADRPHHWDEYPYWTYVRLLVAQGRLQDAQHLLATLETTASRGQRRRKLITVFLLQAVVHQAMGDRRDALSCIEKAVSLAAPENYRRAFLDEGSAVFELLPQVRDLAPGFVSEVLAAGSSGATSSAARPAQPLVEPLTERELEILRLIAAGRSNPEIAELLYLSLNTVKWHAKNLYGKLGASSRIEAVARGQELELL